MTKRLVVSYLAVTLVVLVLLEVPFGIFYERREIEQLTSAVDRDASVVATIYEDTLENGSIPDPTAAERYARRTGARVVLVDRRGVSLVDTEQTVPRDFSTRPEIATALAGRRSTGTRASRTLDTDLLYVAVPVASGGEVYGALRLTLDTRDVDAQVGRFWLRLAAIALVVVAAICLVGWLAARSVTHPLRRLNETARRYGRGELDAPPPTGGPPEVRELADTMAAMAAELSGLIAEQRAFVADASHQLRTPLTGLRLRLENLQSQLDAAGADQIDAAVEEIDRLSTLVGDLLRLARADRHAEVEPTDLAVVAAERVDIWSAVADASDVALVLRADDDHLVCGAVPGALEQVLDNLVDNAIGAAPPGSTITVTVGRADSGPAVPGPGTMAARLVVADQGPGLGDEDKLRATRRFWRGDASRPGSGLGLAIVAELVRSSGGELGLEDVPGGGLAVRVDLPPAR